MEKSSNIRLIILKNFEKRGNEIALQIEEKYGKIEDLIVPLQQPRFSNGEGKVLLEETVRQKNVFILSDVGNYGCTYKLYGVDHIMTPDEHFQDIKRVISAMKGHAASIHVVTPLLYESRQHKGKGRESLDCALSLQELEALGVNGIVTMDAHDPEVQNAIPNLPFDNFYPTYTILKHFVGKEPIDFSNLFIVSPDIGAMERARYYSELLGCDLGLFYKRRDYSIVKDGKNPVVEHTYLGKDVKGKDLLIVDDMIASGESILEVAVEMKKKQARKIYLVASFALFTNGIEVFDKAYEKKIFDGIYTTNLTYIPEKYQTRKWLTSVDCMPYLADIIYTLGCGESIQELLNGKRKVLELMYHKKGIN
ncbi:MAG: ribose-phosphate diphosphokinase [Bacilli bacterium]|nr:ribose-phosphate diphosphokinase [Bacilli bacterium]